MAGNKYARTDKFGRPYQLVGCKDKKGDGFAKGYVEIKGQLYLLEPSDGKKEDKNGNPILYWVKVTKVEQRKRSNAGL